MQQWYCLTCQECPLMDIKHSSNAGTTAADVGPASDQCTIIYCLEISTQAFNTMVIPSPR